MRRPLVIYDFATAPFWIWFSFLSVQGTEGQKTHLATALMVTFIEVCTVAIASQKRGTQDRNAIIKLHSSVAWSVSTVKIFFKGRNLPLRHVSFKLTLNTENYGFTFIKFLSKYTVAVSRACCFLWYFHYFGCCLWSYSVTLPHIL